MALREHLPGLLGPGQPVRRPLARPGGRRDGAVRVSRGRLAAVLAVEQVRLAPPRADLGFQRLLQLFDAHVQFLQRAAGRLGSARLHLRAVAGHQVDGHQALPGAHRQHLHEQAGERVPVPARETGDRGVIDGLVPGDHPAAHVVEAGHLHGPGRADPLAVAVQHQRRHHLRVIGRAALPVAAVVRQECAQVQLIDGIDDRPRQMAGRKPVPRIRRKEKVLVAAVREEVVAHNPLSRASVSPVGDHITFYYRNRAIGLTNEDH